jgi:hypothetical protein
VHINLVIGTTNGGWCMSECCDLTHDTLVLLRQAAVASVGEGEEQRVEESRGRRGAGRGRGHPVAWRSSRLGARPARRRRWCWRSALAPPWRPSPRRAAGTHLGLPPTVVQGPRRQTTRYQRWQQQWHRAHQKRKPMAQSSSPNFQWHIAYELYF